MRRPSPALILALLAVAVGLVLLATSRPPGYTLRADALPIAPVELADAAACQPLRVLADETTAVRVKLAAGSAVPRHVTLTSEGFSVTSGAPVVRGAQATYPLPSPLVGDRLTGQACFEASRRGPAIRLLGQGTTPEIALLGAGRSSWLSAIPLLGERVAFGRGTVLGRGALPLALLWVALAGGLLILLGGGLLG
ncbi:MAG: hypothetical protein Q7T55_15430, partial [Solirubrobacteraceae bacterium]|nr:hypothetical protein [Solirubrobacteraceae bacterium]